MLNGVRTLAVKPDSLRLISRTHIGRRREVIYASCLSTSTDICACTHKNK